MIIGFVHVRGQWLMIVNHKKWGSGQTIPEAIADAKDTAEVVLKEKFKKSLACEVISKL